MKLSNIVNAQPTLQKLAGLELPIATAIIILKVCTDTAVHVQAFQAKQKKLFDKYGTEDEEKKQITIPEDKTDEFRKEMDKVLNADVPLEFTALTVDDFGDEAKLTVTDVNHISWMLK